MSSHYKYVHTYLVWWRAWAKIFRSMKENEAAWFPDRFSGRDLTPRGFHAAMQAALDARICAKGGLPVATASWRKLDEQYQTDQFRDCMAVRDHARRRVRVYQLSTPEMRKRFFHILASKED